MNDLHTWLSQQHHGLRTFRIFRNSRCSAGTIHPSAACAAC